MGVIVLKVYKVTLKKVTSGEYEINFMNPKWQTRVRRKIKTDRISAEKIQKALEFIMESGELQEAHMADIVKQRLSLDESFRSDLDTLWPYIYDLFYKRDTLAYSTSGSDDNDFINNCIPIPDDYPKVLITGNYDTGKSMLLKYILKSNSEVVFPIEDASEAATYTCDYIFKNKSSNTFRFAASFLSREAVKFQIECAIDRAVDTIINLAFETLDVKNAIIKNNEEDAVINSFITDPDNLFDMRFILGGYYKLGSKSRLKEDKKEQVKCWSAVYDFILKITEDADINSSVICDEIKLYPDINSAKEFIKSKYYNYVHDAWYDEDSDYNKLISFILNEIAKNTDQILDSIMTDASIHEIALERDSNQWLSGFSCSIKDFSGKCFRSLISPFVSRDSSCFSKLLTCLVNKMRIEVPFKDALAEDVKNTPVVFTDSIGISNLSSENNISLGLCNYDVITIVDSSTYIMGAGTQNIIRYLTNRVLPDKIFMVYTHFDDFNKDVLINEDDEAADEKIRYLLNIQSNAIKSIIKGSASDSYRFNKQLKEKTFFLSKSIESNDFIASTINYIKSSKDYLAVDADQWPIVEYDYKKLSLIFFKDIYSKYFYKERDIYEKNPPDYKDTEKLIRRLWNGETCFYSSVKSTPADDFYSIIIDSLNQFIMNPKSTHLKQIIKNKNHKDKLLEKLKELIFEEIRRIVVYEFVNPITKKKWKDLYMISGIGSDYYRRKGILTALAEIIPDMDSYLYFNDKDNWIDKLEMAFSTSIAKLEKMIKEEDRNSAAKR